jgi:hypothetical protein
MKALIKFITRPWIAILLIVALFVGLVFFFLVLIDRLAPGLGGQALGVLTAAITAVLAFLGILVTQAINVYTAWSGQRRELENTRESELQKYLEEGFPSDPSNDQKVATMARAHSLLLRLDRNRKGVLLRFFHEAGKIKKDEDDQGRNPLIGLSGANLSGAKLAAIDLRGDSLRGANLRGADLRGANLSGANLMDVDLGELEWNDLSMADLIRVYVEGSHLDNPKPGSADLRGASLCGADLTGAKGLSQEQLSDGLLVWGDDTTKLPEGLDRPRLWTQLWTNDPYGE